MQGSSIKILLVENNSSDAALIRKLLSEVRGQSFQIKWVDCIETASSLISETAFDLILLDLNLPDSAGSRTISVARKKAPRTPIVAITDTMNDRIAIGAIKLGAQDLLSKDILNEDNLSRVIRYSIERNRIQNELRARNEKYMALFEESNDAIFIHDLSGNILDVNPQALQILGYKKSELLSKRIAELHPPNSLEVSKSAFEKIRTKGRTVFEIDFRCKNGRVINAEVSASVFEIDDKNLVQGIVRDVTERKMIEDKLKLQDKALRSSANGIVITERDGTIIWVNPAFTKLTGYQSHEVIGKNPRILKSTLQDKSFYGRMWDTIISGKIWQGEMINLRKDGKLYFEEQIISPVRNDDGEVSHFVGIKTDVTEKKLAEDTLKESEQKFRAVAETATDAIISVDSLGNITYFNNAAERIFGFRNAELSGKPFKTLIPEKAHKKELDHLVRASNRQAIGKAVELVGMKKNGDWFPIEISFSSWMSGGETYVTSIIRDITERKRAEESFRDRDQKLRTIVEHSNELFYIHDTKHQLTYVSPQSEEILGYTPEEMMVKWTTFVTDKPINDEGIRLTELAIKTGKTQRPYLLELRRKDGQTIIVEIEESPIVDENRNVVGISGALRDITEKKKAELALIESEEKFRSLAERSPNMIFINQDGNIVYANRKSVEILGYSKEELYSPKFSFQKLIAPESLRLVKKSFQSHSKGGNIGSYEYTIITKGGKRIEAINSTELIDYEGRRAILGVVTDITERKHSELSLRESEERLKILFEFAPDAILLADLKGNLINVNKAATDMTGYSRQELVGKNLLTLNLLSENQVPKVAKLIARNATNRPTGPDEFAITKMDGCEITIEIRTFPVKIQNQLLILGIARDITERRNAEDAIRNSEEKFRTLFEESKDTIYISSTDGKFIDVNPAGVELFGYKTKDQLLKVDIVRDLYVNPADRQRFQNELVRAGYVQDFEVSLKRKDGEKLAVLLTATPIKDADGRITSYRGFIRDVTEQKKLEQQLLQAQKMEAIGTLAGGIAHDFNNILSAILGYTELTIKLMNGNGLAKKNLDQVYRAGLRAKDLIQQILTFSRQAGHTAQPLKMELIVKEALKLLRASLPATIKIIQNLEKDCGHIMADPTQIHQIVVNLCTNAHDAMRESGGLLHVTLNSVEIGQRQSDEITQLPPGKYLALTVNDTGTGMSEDITKRIFDPFFTTKEAGTGTGLGLSVVHGIVKKHGGEITVRSEIGKGTTFVVYLPASESKNDPITERPQEFMTGSERILYVDDEEPIVSAGVQILNKLGYDVTGKTQSREALETFEQSPEYFDLVISDLTMPNMTGIDLAKRILEIRPDIPIILITGFSETITRDKAQQIGIRDLIMKPTLTAELSQTIRRILDTEKVGG
jgi:PAS domain S-box-containing protein